MKWRPHPLLPIPTDEELAVMEPEEIIEYHRSHHESIAKAESDPYRYGFKLPHWEEVERTLHEDDEALILGGNRSGKTEFAAWSVVKAAVENPDAEIFCFAQNSKISIRQQQKAVWRYLPAEYKKKILGAVANVSYTKKNGFSDASLILPNGSQIVFLTYSQFQQDDTILEGAELGSKDPKWINLGIWLDEYLGGPALIETIRNRLATRDSKLLVTFTPLKGWTEVVRSYLEGARTLKETPAELLNGEMVPLVQKCRHRNATVHYFHSIANPFGGYDRIKRNLAGKDKATILVRAYGVPTKSFTTVFPKFSTTINVIKPEDIPTHDVTRYHVIDPAGRKNWFMCWIAVDASDCWYIYREWPGVDIGEWAEPDEDGGWKPGEGCRGQGFGLRSYIEAIYTAEGRKYNPDRDAWTGGEDIIERLIDPRLAAAKYQREDGDSCIIDDLNELDFIVIPAPGDHIEDGLQKLVDRMDYDPGKAIDFTNRPLLYISEECENTISAFGNYTGTGGKDEAWKDPIDCPRYAAAAGIQHFPADTFAKTARVGAGGY